MKNIAINNLPSFDYIAQLFYKLVYKKNIYMNYLKKNKLDKWLEDIIQKIEIKQNEGVNTIDTKNNEDFKNEEPKKEITEINEANFPKLDSNHSILTEKTQDFNFGIKFNKNIEIKGAKTKMVTKKSYDGIEFIKLFLEDLKTIKI